MADERYNIFRPIVHWRSAMGELDLTFFDARLISFVALFLYHIRWWTFVVLIFAIAVFTVANHMFRSRLIGQRRSGVPYTQLQRMVK